TPSVFPIMSIVLTGGDNPSKLRDYAYFQLAPLVKNIPDVYRADVAGGDLREIEVEARPEALFAARVSAADLGDHIRQAHRRPPASSGSGVLKTRRSLSRFSSTPRERPSARSKTW